MFVSRAGVFAVCFVAGSWLTAGTASAQESPLFGTIRGQVVDDLNGLGLPGATLQFLDGARRVVRAAVADDHGFFVLPQLPPGQFQIRVTQFGYLQTTTPTWWVEAGEMMEVVVRLRPDAILLAPLEVVALSRIRAPVVSGFYRRMESAPAGTFIDRAWIEARKASRVTDLLADLPGVRLERGGESGRERTLTLGRALLASGGGRCPVQVFVDGILASRGGGAVPIDDVAYPDDLEGIELYRGLSSVPAEFLTPDARCGVIVLWTRRGRDPLQSDAVPHGQSSPPTSTTIAPSMATPSGTW